MVTLKHQVQTSGDMVSLTGRFVAADSPAVSDQLHSIIEQGSGQLALDLAELEFIDSSALAVLVAALKFARKSGGDVVLHNVNLRIMALLKLTRLHEIFEICETQDPQRIAAQG